ncbi:MAG: energy transducer TonB [Syntrophobacterales bacterium]|nr:energy transducer TonB [Syntrophobacterales bacterium]
MDKDEKKLIFGRREAALGLRKGIFLSLGVHGLTAMILMAALAASTPPRLARDIDPCIHVDLVSLAAVAAHRESLAAPPAVAAAAQEKSSPKNVPLPPPATPVKSAHGEQPPRAAAMLASLGRLMPFGHDGGNPGEKGKDDVARVGANSGSATATARGAAPPGGKETDGTSNSLAVPRYHENPHPAYPRLARLRGHEGVVLLTVEVLPDGKVGRLQIKSSSGYTLLDQSALDSIKKWSFEPGRKMGVPVAMWVDVPIRFRLH